VLEAEGPAILGAMIRGHGTRIFPPNRPQRQKSGPPVVWGDRMCRICSIRWPRSQCSRRAEPRKKIHRPQAARPQAKTLFGDPSGGKLSTRVGALRLQHPDTTTGLVIMDAGLSTPLANAPQEQRLCR